ncbi:MAG: LuxR C-terminal-related transcriptional regulator [Lutibacter sp.]
MNEKDSTKVLSLWESENKILQPNKKELLLGIVDQVVSLFAVGSFYYYVFNFENLKMDYVNEGTMGVLGIASDQFTVEKVFEIMHPEDLASMNEKEALAIDFFLNKIHFDDLFAYKTVYVMRLKHTNGTYKTILHQVSVLSASDEGKIQQVLGVHTDITYLNIPINHNVSFISTKKPSYHYSKNSGNYSIIHENSASLEKINLKNVFSKREKEIVEKLAQGVKFNEIAKLLFVSPHTVNAHKKNILRKSGCKNTPELIARCYVEGLLY